MKSMSLRQMKFAGAVCAGKSPRVAAIEAGFSAKNAHSQGYLLLRNEAVKAWIDSWREKQRELAHYGKAECEAEIRVGMQLALDTKNPSAYAKAVELLLRLHGHLATSKSIDEAHFTLTISGLENPNGNPLVRDGRPASYEPEPK